MIWLRLNTNSTCNLDCKHCYYKAKVWFDGKTMDLNDAKKIIFDAKNIYWNDLAIIIMWWWEPLLYKHLFELLHYSSIELGLITSITTNFLLVNKTILKKLKDLNIWIAISLEWTESYNDKIRWSWVFKKVFKNILLAKEIWNKTVINFTLTHNNIWDIPFIMKTFSDKIDFITFSRYIPYIKNDYIKPLSKEDYLLVENILEKYKSTNLKSRQEQFFNRKNFEVKTNYKFNVLNLKSLYILPDLSVYPAWNLIDYKLWDLNSNSLLDILNNWRLEKLYNPSNLNWDHCNNCLYKFNCAWDRGVAYFYSWNFWWDDIQCPYFCVK